MTRSPHGCIYLQYYHKNSKLEIVQKKFPYSVTQTQNFEFWIINTQLKNWTKHTEFRWGSWNLNFGQWKLSFELQNLELVWFALFSSLILHHPLLTFGGSHTREICLEHPQQWRQIFSILAPQKVILSILSSHITKHPTLVVLF